MLITAALSLLPTIIDLFKDPSAKNVTRAGFQALEAITGKQTPRTEQTDENVVNAIQGLAPDQQKAVIAHMMEKDEIKKEIELRHENNTKNAREMYANAGHGQTDSIANRIMKWNLPVIVSLVIINVLVVWFMPENKRELIAIVSNFIGIAIGQLFNERQAVVNFFFGSSQGSKDKDKP